MKVSDRDRAQLQEALDSFFASGQNKALAARLLSIPESTLKGRLIKARNIGLKPKVKSEDPEKKRVSDMRRQIVDLRAQLKDLEDKSYDLETVKEIIHEVKRGKLNPPKWTAPTRIGVNTGIPTLFLSDWHWDEVVRPEQVNYVNAYNRKIATRRLNTCFTKCVDLLINHMAKPEYPYIVVAMGGDMLSGNIHEELRETNEAPIAKSIINLRDNLIAGLDMLADRFGRVCVYAIPGNHGRFDHKPRFKNKVYDNFEWLLYQFLLQHYLDRQDDRFFFKISDSPDCLFDVYNTKYLMTHGDQAKGGEGVSGAFSPIVRMDLKKRKRQMAIKQYYDYLMAGHWHTYITPSKGTIINGSGKGFDEYALDKNFDFEIPTQAMWVTHPDYGITIRWPIFLEALDVMFDDHFEIVK